MQNVTVQNCSRYGFDPHALTTNLTLQSCVAINNLDGFTVDACGTDGIGNGVRILDCISTGNQRHGFNLTTGVSNLVMSGVTATNNGVSGIVVQTGDNEIRDWTDNIMISGGVVGGNGVNGIRVTQAEQVRIENVNFQNQGPPLIELAGVRPDPNAGEAGFGAQIVGCTINGTVALTPLNGLSVKNYLQTFNTAATDDDRWIATSGVFYGQAAASTAIAAAGENLTGAALWAYAINDHRGLVDDIVTGSSVADSIAAGRGNDIIDGADGNDKIYGEDGSDALTGGRGDDQLLGGSGADALKGGDGHDVLSGGRHDDVLDGGAGNDAINGGTGIDTADYGNALAGVTVSLLITVQQDTRGAALDTLALIENVTGSDFGDALTGDARANLLKGGLGGDTLSGGAGLDRLQGGASADYLYGGTDNDVLLGGQGLDRQTGGTGSDIFDFNSVTDSVVGVNRDIIYDFEYAGKSGGDRIDLSTIDANSLVVGNQAFAWKGTAALTGAQQARFGITQSGNTIIYVSTDADSASEFEITLKGRHALNAADFVM